MSHNKFKNKQLISSSRLMDRADFRPVADNSFIHTIPECRITIVSQLIHRYDRFLRVGSSENIKFDFSLASINSLMQIKFHNK